MKSQALASISEAVFMQGSYDSAMFSYRHAFHAGNHADVLKHTTLIALMKYLTQKDTALTVIDTHAGAGLYRLDGDYTETCGEASEGVFKLISASKAAFSHTGQAQAATKKIAVSTQVIAPAANAALPEKRVGVSPVLSMKVRPKARFRSTYPARTWF